MRRPAGRTTEPRLCRRLCGTTSGGFLQKLLSVAGITPSGSADTVLASDYYDALTSNAVKASLGSVDAGDVPGDRTVTNTGKGVSYGRYATGIVGTSDVRTDLIMLPTPPSFSETSPGSGVWTTTYPSIIVPSMPPQILILGAALVFDYDPSGAPLNDYRAVCPAYLTHSLASGSSFSISSMYVLSGLDPGGPGTSNHFLRITYEATW
jgi:hypothetical protein